MTYRVLGLKNQYCQNVKTVLPKAIYIFNAIPIKSNGIFHRTRTKNFKICMETQKTPQTAKIVLRKNRAGGLQTILQNYSHQNSVIFSPNTQRSMEQDRVPRNKPIH